MPVVGEGPVLSLLSAVELRTDNLHHRDPKVRTVQRAVKRQNAACGCGIEAGGVRQLDSAVHLGVESRLALTYRTQSNGQVCRAEIACQSR